MTNPFSAIFRMQRNHLFIFLFFFLFFFKNGCLGFYNCFNFLEQGEFSNVIERKNCVHMCFIKPSGLIGLHFV